MPAMFSRPVRVPPVAERANQTEECGNHQKRGNGSDGCSRESLEESRDPIDVGERTSDHQRIDSREHQYSPIAKGLKNRRLPNAVLGLTFRSVLLADPPTLFRR